MLALVLVFSPSEWLNRACFHWFAVMGIFFNEFNHYKTKSEAGQVFTPEHIHGLGAVRTRQRMVDDDLAAGRPLLVV